MRSILYDLRKTFTIHFSRVRFLEVYYTSFYNTFFISFLSALALFSRLLREYTQCFPLRHHFSSICTILMCCCSLFLVCNRKKYNNNNNNNGTTNNPPTLISLSLFRSTYCKKSNRMNEWRKGKAIKIYLMFLIFFLILPLYILLPLHDDWLCVCILLALHSSVFSSAADICDWI